MNTLTKLALGLMGQLKPLPPIGDAATMRSLPSRSLSGGMPLMSAFQVGNRERTLRLTRYPSKCCRICSGPQAASTDTMSAAEQRRVR